MPTFSITGYTKAQQDALLAGKASAPPSGTAQGYVPTVNAEGGVTYAPPAGGDPAKQVAPAFVFTYDDADDSIYTVGQPIFTAKGVPATAFVNATTIGTANKCSWAQIEEMNNFYLSTGTGYEIQCHENQHDYFDPTTPAATTALATSIETGLATLRSHGVMADYLAYPGHRINKRGQELARRYYLGARCGGAPALNDIHTVDLHRWGTGFGDGVKLTKAENGSGSIEALIEKIALNGSGYYVSCFHSFVEGRYAATTSAATIGTAIDMILAAGMRVISFSQANHEMASRGYLTTNAGAIAP